MKGITSPAAPKRAGLFESAMHKLFMHRTHVMDIEDVGRAFRIITLGGEALRTTAWIPGDKLQIQLGNWVQRTYTPIDWDTGNGVTRILVYLNAGGPGAQWARTVRIGDDCIVFGPRKSIRLAEPRSPVVLFGDETSLGLAAALSNHASPLSMKILIEVSARSETTPAIERLSLDETYVCTRLEGGEHLAELETRMVALVPEPAATDIVLTGKASSIQQMIRVLRKRGLVTKRLQSKAYWAPGKTGLD